MASNATSDGRSDYDATGSRAVGREGADTVVVDGDREVDVRDDPGVREARDRFGGLPGDGPPRRRTGGQERRSGPRPLAMM